MSLRLRENLNPFLAWPPCSSVALLWALVSHWSVQVLGWARESPPDPRKPLDTFYDPETGRLVAYQLERPDSLTVEDLSNPQRLPVIQTADMQRGLDYFRQWLCTDYRQPFLLVGPEGCGKGYSFLSPWFLFGMELEKKVCWFDSLGVHFCSTVAKQDVCRVLWVLWGFSSTHFYVGCA